MHNRLAANLMRYSIEAATESAGNRRRRKRGNGDVWLVCGVLLSIAAAIVALA